MSVLIHIGFPKCASTSLQDSFSTIKSILYPVAGRNGNEHLSLPLFLKGNDDWTRQFYSDEWVEAEHKKFMEEIEAYSGLKVISSERLVSLNEDQIVKLKRLFSDEDIQIVAIVRDRDKFIASMWRHAVFRHDYPFSFSVFRDIMAKFDFFRPLELFRRHFPVHAINLDDVAFEDKLTEVFKFHVTLPSSNVGIGFYAAERLQKIHSICGTAAFKKFFTHDVKAQFAKMLKNDKEVVVDDFNVPIF